MSIRETLSNTKIPTFIVIIVTSVVFLATYFVFIKRNPDSATPILSEKPCLEKMNQLRLKNYSFTHPLVLTDVSESSTLEPIRKRLAALVDEAKRNGSIMEASIYFRRMDDGIWFTINPSVEYNADVMMKLVYLLVYLKDSESNPRLLDARLNFSPEAFSSNQAGNKTNLISGSTYSVRDLLSRMIESGDDGAENVLRKNINRMTYNKIFSDLEIPIKEEDAVISIMDMSKFLRVLYNGTYISADLSEYGLDLLTKNKFEQGLQQGFDREIKFAHKFGMVQRGKNIELHEMGIVYFENSPFLLGVMTKGNSIDSLYSLLKQIAIISKEEFVRLSE